MYVVNSYGVTSKANIVVTYIFPHGLHLLDKVFIIILGLNYNLHA